jgi:hypothetical protein
MKIGTKDFLAILRAFRLYQLSLLSYREDIGLAYTLLVAAAESVAQHFLKLPFSFADLPDAEDWQKLFNSLKIPESSAGVIKNKLLKNTLFLNIKFRRFIEKFLPDSFWVSADSRAIELDQYINELEREHFGSDFREKENHFKNYWWLYTPERKVTKGELDSVLKNIYDLRSQFAHLGVSPPFEVSDGYETAEMKVEVNNKYHVKYRRAVPSYFWFERVVYESILNLVNSL